MITMTGLVQSEMVWSSLATVKAVAAKLRPAPKKMMSRSGVDRLEAR